MVPHPYSALATLIALAVFFWTIFIVSTGRTKYGIAAPAVVGNEDFERRFRVQMNTLEQLVLMLPTLWLCAIWFNELLAGACGLIWSIGRIIYLVSYLRDPRSRTFGMILTIVPTAIMGFSAAFSVNRFLLVG